MFTSTPESSSRARQVVLEALEKFWKSYRTELKHCRAEFSNEAVHDLRVSTRRMMAIIQLLYSLKPRPRLKKILRRFKGQLDEFDNLRDTQVILAEISDRVQELPDLQEFQRHQQAREEKLLRTLGKKIKKFHIRELSKRIRKTQNSLAGEDDDLEPRIMQAVDDAYLVTKQRLNAVDLEQTSTIHRLRIAFKKLRYMIEIVQPLLPDFPELNRKQMNDYQSSMGEVQDAEVFLQSLSDFSKDASFSDPESVRRHYERRHTEAISAFAEDKDRLHEFWRNAPDQAFPWEKSA